jgi:hypothetical protein
MSGEDLMVVASQWIAVAAIKPNPGNARDDRPRPVAFQLLETIHVARELLRRGARA